MKYIVVYEHAAGAWSASVPDLPGCTARGASREQVRERIREAIVAHLANMMVFGDAIPEPGRWAEEVEIDPPQTQPFNAGFPASPF